MNTEWHTLLQHLMRGGKWGYYWRDVGRVSYWWDAANPAPLPQNTPPCNWYFGVHPASARGGAHQRTTRTTVAAVNALFADFDAKREPAGMLGAHRRVCDAPRSPSVVIRTGGGYHAYWLLDAPFVIGSEKGRTWIEDLQRRWVALVGADPQAADLPRVLRIPGTHNRKYDPPEEVRIVRAALFRQYTLLDLVGLCPPPQPVERPRPAAHSNAWDHAMRQGDKTEWARRLLERLQPGRADDYGDWLRVGLALSQLGEEGLEMWERWSAQSPKYRPGECARKWGSFDGSGVSLGTLYHMARQDGHAAP